MSELPSGYEWDESLELGDETTRLTVLNWPRYLCEPGDLPEPSLSFEIEQNELALRFPNWGIRRVADRTLVAHLGAVMISADLTEGRFPDTGWQFAIEASYASKKANCMCLLVANVDPEVASRGLSRPLLEKAKASARARGVSALIAPVRPPRKSEFPFLPMAEYLAKRTETGEVFDPWLRTHVKSGAEILNICPESNLVRATVSKWREWTGLALAASGEYVLPGGLVPLSIDIERNLGIYREPGVWVRYELGR